jgi:hypothetical protein
MRSTYLICLACLLVLALSACKPQPESAASKPAPAEKAAATTAPVKEKSEGLFGGMFTSEPEPTKLELGEFKLLEVSLGTALDADNLVAKPKTQFGTKDKIYASVLSNGKHQGLNIKARWTAPDGSLVAETEQALVPIKGTVSTFSIGNTQPWPIGAYTLDISLNGLVQRTVSFEVK